MIRPPLFAWLVIVPLWLALPTPHAEAQSRKKKSSSAANNNPSPDSSGPGTAPRPALFPSSSSPRGYSNAPVPPPRSMVPLPFNLMWGDSRQKLASLFAGVGAKITEKKPTPPNSEVWTVQGLIAPGLQASLFTFQDDLLAALEFDYGDPNWDTAKFNDIMGQLRRRLEGLYGGPGEMISRKTEQEPNTPIKQTLMGYKWMVGDTLVQLFYFSAEEKEKNLLYRTISVHYHYQDPQAPASASPDAQSDPNTASNVGAAPSPSSPGNPAAVSNTGPAVSVPSNAKSAPSPAAKPADDNALPEN